jgi:hypothetical protein
VVGGSRPCRQPQTGPASDAVAGAGGDLPAPEHEQTGSGAIHQLEARIEAHVFIAFLAYCLHVTLARRLHALAPGLTPRSVLEKLIDVHLPTTDGRELVLTRYTEPVPELNLLLNKLKLDLPAQPPPKITAEPVPPTPL